MLVTFDLVFVVPNVLPVGNTILKPLGNSTSNVYKNIVLCLLPGYWSLISKQPSGEGGFVKTSHKPGSFDGMDVSLGIHHFPINSTIDQKLSKAEMARNMRHLQTC